MGVFVKLCQQAVFRVGVGEIISGDALSRTPMRKCAGTALDSLSPCLPPDKGSQDGDKRSNSFGTFMSWRLKHRANANSSAHGPPPPSSGSGHTGKTIK